MHHYILSTFLLAAVTSASTSKSPIFIKPPVIPAGLSPGRPLPNIASIATLFTLSPAQDSQPWFSLVNCVGTLCPCEDPDLSTSDTHCERNELSVSFTPDSTKPAEISLYHNHPGLLVTDPNFNSQSANWTIELNNLPANVGFLVLGPADLDVGVTRWHVDFFQVDMGFEVWSVPEAEEEEASEVPVGENLTYASKVFPDLDPSDEEDIVFFLGDSGCTKEDGDSLRIQIRQTVEVSNPSGEVLFCTADMPACNTVDYLRYGFKLVWGVCASSEWIDLPSV